MTEEEKNKANPPIGFFRDKELCLKVWQNKTKPTDDKPVKNFFSYTFDRTYEGEDGKPQSTNSWNHQHLLRIANLCTDAYNVLRIKKNEERESLKKEKSQEEEPEV